MLLGSPAKVDSGGRFRLEAEHPERPEHRERTPSADGERSFCSRNPRVSGGR